MYDHAPPNNYHNSFQIQSWNPSDRIPPPQVQPKFSQIPPNQPSLSSLLEAQANFPEGSSNFKFKMYAGSAQPKNRVKRTRAPNKQKLPTPTEVVPGGDFFQVDYNSIVKFVDGIELTEPPVINASSVHVFPISMASGENPVQAPVKNASNPPSTVTTPLHPIQKPVDKGKKHNSKKLAHNDETNNDSNKNVQDGHHEKKTRAYKKAKKKIIFDSVIGFNKTMTTYTTGSDTTRPQFIRNGCDAGRPQFLSSGVNSGVSQLLNSRVFVYLNS